MSLGFPACMCGFGGGGGLWGILPEFEYLGAPALWRPASVLPLWDAIETRRVKAVTLIVPIGGRAPSQDGLARHAKKRGFRMAENENVNESQSGEGRERRGRGDRKRSFRPRKRGFRRRGEGGDRREREPKKPLPEDVPLSERFAELGLSEQALKAVYDLGYENPTPVQQLAIPEVLEGRDLLAAAQTGTGKTAAFLLPALDRTERGGKGCHPSILVVTPTRELAQQIDEHARTITRRTGHYTLTVVGGLSYGPQRSALKRGVDLLVATPGRLVDLINQGAAHLDCVKTLVLDEADRMLDMGFLPDVRTIVDLTPEDRQTLLFSATLDDRAIGSIKDLVHDPARVEIVPEGTPAETVEQYVLPCAPNAKNKVLLQLLEENGPEHTIVFVRTKRRADMCMERLQKAGISAEAIHGDRSQAQRQRALKAFRKGKVDVIVATDVLARGIDVQDVRYVVNFDLPEEETDYIHRIGRTGRAGETGWAVTIVTPQDVRDFYSIEKMMDLRAETYDAEGIDVGDEVDVPFVDPERVPSEFDPRGGKKKRGGKGKSKGKRDVKRREKRDGKRGEKSAEKNGDKREGKRREKHDGDEARERKQERKRDHDGDKRDHKRDRKRAEKGGDAEGRRSRVRDAELEGARKDWERRQERKRASKRDGGRPEKRGGRAGREGERRGERGGRPGARNRSERRGHAATAEPFYSRFSRGGKRRPGDHGGRR